MKTNTKLIISGIAASLIAVSCVDFSSLENQVQDLTSRVTALETQIANLNSNIKGLQTLAGGGTITEVKTSEGPGGITYTITTSNGSVITLKQGSIGVGNAPVMSIDKDGYWMVDYGNGPEYVLREGEKVSALGQNGKTPLFSVDSENYWTVSYDNGATYTRVLDTNGNPVKAIDSTQTHDSYFKDVKVSDDKLELTMKNDDVFVIPIIKDFYCIIYNTSDSIFNYRATKAYEVEMKGVAKTIVTAPEGWTASLSESRLKVTAPDEPTKSQTLADSRCDVTVLALHSAGYASISKVTVALSGVIVIDAPVATVKALEPASNAAYFKVYVDDATEWYWLILPASEEAPTPSQIMTDGKKETEISKTVSITGANEQTLYTCYVIPLNGEEKGAIAQASVKTAAEADQYTSYMAGKNIVIGGQVFNKAQYGDAIHVTENLGLTENCKGIYFVDPGVEVSTVSKSTRSAGDLIITSYNPAARGKFRIEDEQIIPKSADQTFIFNNLDVTLKKNNIVYYGGLVKKFAFHNCFIDILGDFLMTGTAKLNNVEVVNCDIKVHSMFRLMPGTQDFKMESVNISGNNFYSNDSSLRLFVFFSNSGDNVKTSIASLTMDNNLFYNMYCTRAVVNALSVDKFHYRNNITTYPAVCENYQRILYLAWDNDQLTSPTPEQYAKYPSEGTVSQNASWNSPRIVNIVYKASDRLKDKTWYATSYEEKENLAEDPMQNADPSTGEFKLKPAYKSYGPQRN